MMLAALVVVVACLVVFVTADKVKVVVTGAAGRTGGIIFQKLLNSTEYDPVGVVHTPESKAKLLNSLKNQPSSSTAADLDTKVLVADVADTAALLQAFTGAVKLIICTSATPKINLWSLPKVVASRVVGKKTHPKFTYPEHGDPYVVDWLGGRNQIDAAKASGIKHVVLVSSMGGTQPDHFLNSMGKRDGDENSGNILVWKRHAERYLIDSDLPYTIVHAGGLTDKAGGQAPVAMGFDDEMMQREARAIPRADVAEVCVQALGQAAAERRSFDVVSDSVTAREGDDINASEGAGTGATTNWDAFFAQAGNNRYD